MMIFRCSQQLQSIFNRTKAIYKMWESDYIKFPLCHGFMVFGCQDSIIKPWHPGV